MSLLLLSLTQFLEMDYLRSNYKEKFCSSKAKKNYLLLKPSANANFEAVYEGTLLNFQKRNISLLEFTDFMESYNQAKIQLNELKKIVVLSGEELNSTVNKNLF